MTNKYSGEERSACARRISGNQVPTTIRPSHEQQLKPGECKRLTSQQIRNLLANRGAKVMVAMLILAIGAMALEPAPRGRKDGDPNPPGGGSSCYACHSWIP